MIAKESVPFLLITGVPCAVLLYAGRSADSGVAAGLGGLLFVLTAFIAFFFRDPERNVPEGDALCVAGGDGKVVAITQVDDDWVGKAVQVSVFLSIFNVHVNRVPASGRVVAVDYHPGKFGLAFRDKASEDNEHTVIRIDGDGYRMTFKQIAGFVARRIICRLEVAQTVETGERYGLIRFGSRIDHIIPAGSELTVALGDRVKAGETVIGVMHT